MSDQDLKAVVFLDIDGVLNSIRWLNSLTPEAWPDAHIDPAAVAVLREIVKRTGAKVVISSTWRKNHTLEEITKYLRDRGFDGEIIGATPDFFGLRHQRTYKAYVRGDEIQAWIDQNGPIESFVILDDSEDMVHLSNRLIQTNGDDGLLWKHIDLAVAHLTRKS